MVNSDHTNPTNTHKHMSYQIVTEVNFTPDTTGKEVKVKMYPSGNVAFEDKKTKYIPLPSGLMYKHAEAIAETLMDMGYYSSYCIVKIND